MTFSETISRNLLNTLSMGTYLILFLIIMAGCITCLALNERYRIKINKAESKLTHYINNYHTDENIDDSEFFSQEEIEILKKTTRKKIPAYIVSVIMFILIICMALGSYAMLDTYRIARTHGYRASMFTNASSLWDSINLSPKEDKLPADYTNKIIICYRFGCTDCELTYNELSETFANRDDVYWVASRSNQGSKIIEEYEILTVPTGLYITNDDYFTYQLYTDSFNQTTVDTTNVENLISTANYYEERMNDS